MVCFSKTISKLKVKLCIHDQGIATSLVVLFYCRATADILTNFLQHCFLFLIVVVIPDQ